jgi:8-hydroxy-5-deazaflavin:NADPH oxidoreductase
MVRMTTSTVTANAGNLLGSYPGGTLVRWVLVAMTLTFAHGLSHVNQNAVQAAAARQCRTSNHATDDDLAAAAAERLITAAGFEPVRVGGVGAAVRIEVPGGDLHQNGGLNGRVLDPRRGSRCRLS